MMTQTLALLLDAYRELNARKLFWITLMLSTVIVAAFALVGINEKGMTLLWWEFEHPLLNSNVIPLQLLYKVALVQVAIPVWLAWGAAILGLVSTSSIIPDFIAGGAIELSLSKPIGRLRLLLTKFATALLFMLLQVFVFSFAAYLLIGFRGGVWELRLFLAIPIMVLFFSYLYAVCLLLGLLTRSTIASLLLTLVFWFCVFGLNTTEQVFLGFRLGNELRVEEVEKRLATLRAPEGEPEGEVSPGRVAAIERSEKQLAEYRDSGAAIRRGHTVSFAAKTLAPKTQETIKLLERYLISDADRARLERLGGNRDRDDISFGDGVRIDTRELSRRQDEVLRKRSLGWVLGTSLAFEAVVLALAGWIFCRRDF